MSLSGIAKFFIGFVVGILLLAGAGVATGFYFFTKLSSNPPKPIFAEERPKASPTPKKANAPTASNSQPTSQPTPTPSKPPVTEELPPGAYKARVTWSEGLSLRDAPGSEANRVGGVAFNQEVIVLKESDDRRWQQVRLAEGTQEGWIKAGNIERVN
ncbi:MAG: SH3 domain-containing protein [Coleofasciculus sp. S288]|nr:SH3 domain-containing protein [Coleofasciculus sp. S288]